MRLIDADIILKKFEPKPEFECFSTDLNGIQKIIEEAPTVEAVPRNLINKAILEIKQLQKQEDAGIGYYNPPYYCERCLMILEAIIERGSKCQ